MEEKLAIKAMRVWNNYILWENNKVEFSGNAR